MHHQVSLVFLPHTECEHSAEWIAAEDLCSMEEFVRLKNECKRNTMKIRTGETNKYEKEKASFFNL